MNPFPSPDTETAKLIKRRCLKTLGFDEWWKSHTDGLQVLRYEEGQAYVSHSDYLREESNEEDDYNYETAGVGGNRFATVLFYFTDVEKGGETMFKFIFPNGTLVEDPTAPETETIAELRESGEIDLLEPGSWEEQQTALCRTRLSVRPRAGRAVLVRSYFSRMAYVSRFRNLLFSQTMREYYVRLHRFLPCLFSSTLNSRMEGKTFLPTTAPVLC